MPNKRRAGQMFLGFQADLELVGALDQARGRKDRSLFIREAISEKLAAAGIRVREELIYPPPRAAQVIIENNYGSGSQSTTFGKVSYSAKKKKTKKKSKP